MQDYAEQSKKFGRIETRGGVRWIKEKFVKDAINRSSNTSLFHTTSFTNSVRDAETRKTRGCNKMPTKKITGDLGIIRLQCNKGCGRIRRDIKNDVNFKHTKYLLDMFKVETPAELQAVYVCESCRKSKKPIEKVAVPQETPTPKEETQASNGSNVNNDNLNFLIPSTEIHYVSRKIGGKTDLSILQEAFDYNLKNSDRDNVELFNVLIHGDCGCYDEQTDVLTKEGWKSWKDVTNEDYFASLSKKGELEYHKAKQIIKKQYSGKMVGWKNRAIDICVTPDHNMLLKSGRIVPANQLKGTNVYPIPRTAKNWNAKNLVTPAFAKLMGIFLADGFVQRSKGKPNVIIICAKKQRKRDYFESVIKENNLHYTKNEVKLYICNSVEAQKFNHFGKSFDKFVPNEIKNSGKDVILAFLEAFGQGDGYLCNDGHYRYYTSSKRLADDLQELLLKVGKLGVISTRNKFRTAILKDGRVIQQRRIHYEINVREAQKESWLDFRDYYYIDYDGFVYCAELPPHHTLYVRRNGKSYWCGNSGKSHMARFFAFKSKLPYKRLNLNGATTPEELVGQFIPNGHERTFKWVDGWLTKFMRHGGVLVVDEINMAQPEILAILNPVLDRERTLILTMKDGEVIKAHPRFFLISTMNLNYEGTKPLNEALKDRFNLTLEFDYERKVEAKLIKNAKILDFADKLRISYLNQEIITPVSTRTLLAFERNIETFGQNVAEQILFNRFEKTERKVVEEIWKTMVEPHVKESDKKEDEDDEAEK